MAGAGQRSPLRGRKDSPQGLHEEKRTRPPTEVQAGGHGRAAARDLRRNPPEVWHLCGHSPQRGNDETPEIDHRRGNE